MRITLQKKCGPLYRKSRFKDVKDPCPVFDGAQWHIFGSGGSVVDERWHILHATAPSIEGPWVEQESVVLHGISGDHVAAPGVVYEMATGIFHMFVQTDFLATNGTIEYLTSRDGTTFTSVATALTSMPDTEESGIYDPHPAVIAGAKYLVYSGTPRVVKTDTFFISKPDIFLAKSLSGTWDGPWERLGKILDHADIAEHHNQKDDPEYEWGIEGPQLLELPGGKILLNATSFLPQGSFGTRQRVFFAVAESLTGPYKTCGPVIAMDLEEWERGENGHAAAVIEDKKIYLFYQARSKKENMATHANDWRYGLAIFSLG